VPRSLLGILLVLSAQALHAKSDLYFTPQFKTGGKFVNVYSKSVAVTGDGYEPVVRRFSGSSAYLVTSPGSFGPRFEETDSIDGRPPALGHLEIRDAGNTNCYNDSCFTNRQTSGLMFIPLLWGSPPDDIRAGRTWTVKVDHAWEIGPAGVETVKVVSVDSSHRIVILQRDGRGEGSSEDDERGLTITVRGKSVHASIEGGTSHWTGQVIIQAGIVLSDEIRIEHRVTLKSEIGTLFGDERVTTMLSAAPPID
jgi:hypothetical protein